MWKVKITKTPRTWNLRNDPKFQCKPGYKQTLFLSSIWSFFFFWIFWLFHFFSIFFYFCIKCKFKFDCVKWCVYNSDFTPHSITTMRLLREHKDILLPIRVFSMIKWWTLFMIQLVFNCLLHYFMCFEYFTWWG